MKLSTKSRYGLRILFQIALDSQQGKPVKGKVIAQKQKITEPYLEQIMIPLKDLGIIKTVRGCNGGYLLKKSLEEVNVLDVIELFEGELHLVNCSVCEKMSSESCPFSEVWKQLSETLRVKAESITLSSLMEMLREKNKPEYFI